MVTTKETLESHQLHFLKCASAQIGQHSKAALFPNARQRLSTAWDSACSCSCFSTLDFATYHPSRLLPCTYLVWMEPLPLVAVTQFQPSLPSRMQQRSSLKSQPTPSSGQHSLMDPHAGPPCVAVNPLHVWRHVM